MLEIAEILDSIDEVLKQVEKALETLRLGG
jgi:hypothetical protein